jgi:thioredoxin
MAMKTFKQTLLSIALVLSALCAFAQSGNKVENTSGEVIVLNKKDFIEKIFNYQANKDTFIYEGKLPCIIDFYADWCGPCKRVEPILKELAKENKGKIIVDKINTDNERELAKFFNISSIPTYFFISHKGELQYFSGALPRESFVKVIDEFLLKSDK